MELYDDDRPTPSAMLSRRMRKARESAGLSLRGLGEQIRFPYGFLGRVERGEQPATDALVKELDRFFGTQDLFAELLEMAQELAIPIYSRDFLRREREALRIQVFTSSLIPGLLQTRTYATELFRVSLPWESSDERESRANIRIKRQHLLNHEESPFYWAIMDEAALKRPPGRKDLMREQIKHILKIGEKPRVVIQVLPFEQALHPMLGGGLTLLTLQDGSTIAYVESFASGEPVESPKRVAELVQYFEIGCSMALPKKESLELIRGYLGGYEDVCDS
ncbi:helix-turn-helix domain-containing protein [Streptomyces sp. NBC_01803]|uniref:helix-turn-helix domain-containing protein n=1 Tax=Streptomyces sp. NBC_01803 TaxID=2975946 RepID=UPI002DDAFF39|nr:helix-turn-helix transcriptional regulator [Streptomyces sp. NBC_01803]WSA44117.1 helix-turn-helix transcriptional regulator [Streptomyces sp. NBC_01803]